VTTMHLFRLAEDGSTPIPERDFVAFAEWFEDADRLVARTEVRPGVVVSTIYLGIAVTFTPDRAPLLWETLTFLDGDPRGPCGRYASRADAIAGHTRIVARVNGGEA
jgi:hypothetical protein